MDEQVSLLPTGLKGTRELKAPLQEGRLIMKAKSEQFRDKADLLVKSSATSEDDGLNCKLFTHVKEGQKELDVKLERRELRGAESQKRIRLLDVRRITTVCDFSHVPSDAGDRTPPKGCRLYTRALLFGPPPDSMCFSCLQILKMSHSRVSEDIVHQVYRLLPLRVHPSAELAIMAQS